MSYDCYIYYILAVLEVPVGHYMDLVFYILNSICIYVPGSHIISDRIIFTVNYKAFGNGMAFCNILQDEINVISYVGLSSQIPLRQLKPLTSNNKSMNCIEYFSINIVTVKRTTFQ